MANYFMDRVFQSDPLAAMKRVTPDAFDEFIAPDGLEDYDLVIFDRCVPKRVIPGNYLFLAAVPPYEGFNASGISSDTFIIYNDPTHPVMSNVNIEGLRIGRMLVADVPEHALKLVLKQERVSVKEREHHREYLRQTHPAQAFDQLEEWRGAR